jgi:endonuclease I
MMRWLPASLLVPVFAFGLVGHGLVACGPASDQAAAGFELKSDSGARDGGDRDGGDPYTALDGLRDDELKAALHDLVKDHTSLGYNGARAVMLKLPTLNPGQPLECVYTGRLVQPDGTTTPGGFNTEHSWPQSMGADTEPAHSDLHHLFAVDETANSARASYPYGEVTCLDTEGTDAGRCPFENGGSALGRTAAGQVAFEVRQKTRGNIARAQFYFAVRYERPIPVPVETVLRKWDHEDPTDDEERLRNDNIEAHQHNRNPFVDRADFVDRISAF